MDIKYYYGVFVVNIRIVCVGKIKENFYRDAIAEYAKRLSRFCKFEIVEVAEELCNNVNEKNLAIVKQSEGQRIIAQLKGCVIALDIQGKQYASQQFAQTIKELGVDGISQISFVIGGSYGLSQEVLAKADYKMSFGMATYPHQLMRVILSEQIYRAFMINEGSPYHK